MFNKVLAHFLLIIRYRLSFGERVLAPMGWNQLPHN